MEQIVRPFQTASPIKTKKLNPQVIVIDDGNIPHLCWGRVGTVPDAVEQDEDFDGINFRLEECNDDNREKNRDTHKLRVENPDDPDQYVMVERIDKIKFKHEAKKKLFTSFRTETTAFEDPDPFAGSVFGDVPLVDSCDNTFHMNR